MRRPLSASMAILKSKRALTVSADTFPCERRRGRRLSARRVALESVCMLRFRVRVYMLQPQAAAIPSVLG